MRSQTKVNCYFRWKKQSEKKEEYCFVCYLYEMVWCLEISTDATKCSGRTANENQCDKVIKLNKLLFSIKRGPTPPCLPNSDNTFLLFLFCFLSLPPDCFYSPGFTFLIPCNSNIFGVYSSHVWQLNYYISSLTLFFHSLLDVPCPNQFFQKQQYVLQIDMFILFSFVFEMKWYISPLS